MKKFLFILSLAFSSQMMLAQLPVLADSLSAPIGVYADPWGNKWVAETGTGNNDASVTVITKTGKKHKAFTNLPSALNPAAGDIVGPWRVIQMPNAKMAVLIGGNPMLGANFGKLLFYDMAGFVPGTSTPKTVSDTTNSFDVGAFGLANSLNNDSDPFSAAQDPDGNWYIADAGSNAILRFGRNGKSKSVLARFASIPNPTPVGPPFIDAVPTGIAALPQYEGFLVTTLTGFPFLSGMAKVYHVALDGTVTLWASGLTLLTDIAIDRFRQVYVNQYGRFGLATGFVSGSGMVLKMRQGVVVDTVASGYGPGSGLSLYDSRKFYVTSLVTNQLLGGDIPSESSEAAALTSLEAREQSDRLSIVTFPNPAQHILQVQWKPIQQEVAMRMTDMAGRTIWSQSNIDGTFGYKTINVSAMKAGVYILTHESKQGSYNQKINIVK